MAEIKLPKLKKISDNTSIEPKPRKKKKIILDFSSRDTGSALLMSPLENIPFT